MAPKKTWSDVTSTQRKAVFTAATVELFMTAWAVRDLRRRAAADVRGPKAAWGASFAVQPFGPLAYWTFGRR